MSTPLTDMSATELYDKQREIDTKIRGLGDEAKAVIGRSEVEGRGYSAGDQERVDRLQAGIGKLSDQRSAISAEIKTRIKASAAAGYITPGTGPVVVRDDDWSDLSARDRGLRAVESDRFATDEAKQAATALIERDHDRGDDRFATYVAAVADPHYLRAFTKLLARPDYPQLLEPIEAQAMARSQAAQRAMSLTDAAGGYGTPLALDPSIIPTDGTSLANPIRRLARRVTITTDSWAGVSSAGVTGSWDGEAGEVSDDAPTLAQPSITPEKLQIFVPYSIEIGMDYPGFAEEIRMLFAEEKARLESQAFWSGVGASNQPVGIQTALVGGSYEYDAAGEALTTNDVYGVAGALAERSWNSPSCAWVMARDTGFEIRKLATAANDNSSWTDLETGDGSLLLGKGVHFTDRADPYSGVSAAETASNYLMVVGDWSKYIIVDRAGMQVELVPHLFATANNRPSGQRGLYAWARVGADSVDDSAFQLMKLTTSGA